MKDYNKIQELADEFEVGTTETTIGMNGYPKGVDLVLTDFDTITSLNAVCEGLKGMLPNSEVHIIELSRRDGQDLWNRTDCTANKGKYAMVNDTDWTVVFDPETDNAEELAFEVVCEDRDTTSYETLMLMCEIMEAFKEELEAIDEKSRIFYDPDNNYTIKYIVTDESTGYSYDTHNTKLGIMIDFAEEDLVITN